MLEDGTINIYGSDFELNGSPVGAGPIAAGSGTITGLLEDNSTQTSITFDNNPNVFNGTINLVVVPEPAGACLLAVSSLLCARGRRRRRSV